jgi:hypothetical protein
MLEIIRENDAIEISDLSNQYGLPSKIVLTGLALLIILPLSAFNPLFSLLLPIVGWIIWKPYATSSILFDRKTLKVYSVATKQQQRSLTELAQFSELGKFQIIEKYTVGESGSGYVYHICIDVKNSIGEKHITLTSGTEQREMEDLCSELEQFVLASLRGAALIRTVDKSSPIGK